MSVNTTRIDRINYRDQPWNASRNEIINTRTTERERRRTRWKLDEGKERGNTGKGWGEKGCMRSLAWIYVCTYVHVWACVTALSISDTTRTRARMHLPTVSLLLMAAIRHPVYCPQGSVDISFVPHAPLHAGWGTIPDRVQVFDRTTTTTSTLMHERG